MDRVKKPTDLVDKVEAAVLAGVTPRTIERWRKLGHLPAWRDGYGRVFFSRAVVLRYAIDLATFKPEEVAARTKEEGES